MKSRWLKKTGKITGYALGGVVLFLVFLGGMLHTSPVQSLIARKAAGFATGFMDCEVRVGKMDFNLFKRSATLRHVEVFDGRHNRTVFVAEAMASLKNYNFKNLTLASIALYDPEIHITRYKGDTISDFKRVIQKIAALPKKDTALRKPFRIEKGRIFNGTFTYEAQDAKHSPEGVIDYKHVGLGKVYAEASDFYSRCGIVLVKVQHVECTEKTGFRVEDFSTSLYLNKGELHFTDAYARTPQSTVRLDYHLTAANWQLYKDFIHNVRMESDLRASEVMLSDLGYFARVFAGMEQQVRAEGRVNGTVDDLDLKNLRLGVGKHTFLYADLALAGLPKVKDGRLDLKLDGLHLNTEDLKGWTLPDGTPLSLPEALQSLHWAKAKGTFSGGQRQFAVDLEICTDIGDVVITNAARDTAEGMDIMAGNIRARGIRLDKLFRQDTLLGKVSVNAEFRLSRHETENFYCHAKGQVFDFEIDRKVLDTMPFHVDWRRDLLKVDVACADPNLDFDLLGRWEKKHDTTWLSCELGLRNIDLRPLRLMGDTGDFTVKTHLVADNVGYGGESLKGRLQLDGTEIHRLNHTYRLDRLQSEVYPGEGAERIMRLRSGLMEADLTGEWNFVDLKYSVLNTVDKCLPHLGEYLTRKLDSTGRLNRIHDFDLRVRVNNADSLMQILYPPVSLPLGMRLNLRYASREDRGRVQMAIPYVQVGSFAYLDGYFDAALNNNSVQLETTADRFYLNDSVCMNRFSVKVNKSDTNTVDYNLSWGNDGLTRQSTNGRFAGLFHFLPEGGMRWEFQDFNLQTRNTVWKSYSDGYVLFAPQLLEMHHVGMFSTSSFDGISLEGTVSRDPNSVLQVQFKDFNLSYLEFFLRKVPMQIETKIDGTAEVKDFYGDLAFNARLKLRDLYINKKSYGRGNVDAAFGKDKLVRASVNVIQDDKKTILALDGTYNPRQEGKLDFKGFAKDCPVNFLDRILATVATDLEGEAGGSIHLGGTLRSPELFADLACRNFALTVSMLKTRYGFEQVPVKLTPTRIDFGTSPFVDKVFNTGGKFGGYITHRNFKDVRLNLNVGFNNLVALRTTRAANLPFWGTVFATGVLDVKGPVEDIVLQLNARTEENSDIFFDFSNPTGGDGANFITFKEPVSLVVDSGRMTLEKYYVRNRAASQRKGKLTLDFNLEVTPDLDVSVRLRNAAMDGLLTATGKGALRLYMDDDMPQIFGTYTVNGGSFDFSMVNLLNKKFKLQEGGTVAWLGNAGEPRVDVRAGYQTKASLYPVLSAFSPDESRYKQKVNVESIIALSGNLLNPDISFDIDLLNADDDTKDKFWALVRKNNEDEMLQQTFSLLMFNSFMAVESGSSSSVGSSALASSSEMLFSQFNNFLSRLSNDFNVGINYKPGSSTSNSEFQVMMSGQLFNDRLVINGNLGVADNATGTATSNTTVVGDVDIEWKFTEELRLRGFNHSNDEDLTKPVNSYTQGVGIVFRRDFDNLNEFLHGTTPRLTKAERKAERKKNREIRQKKRLER